MHNYTFNILKLKNKRSNVHQNQSCSPLRDHCSFKIFKTESKPKHPLQQKADKEGFEVDAVSVALAHCVNLDLDPLTWLRQYWKANVTRVMERAWGQGATAEHNCVGEMTFTEAQAAYMQSEGHLMEAVQACVESRRKLVRYFLISLVCKHCISAYCS